MDRETKTIKTESGHEIVYYTRMTGGEYFELEDREIGENVEIEGTRGQTRINAGAVNKARRRALADLLIVSVDGEKDIEKRWKLLTEQLWADELIEIFIALNRSASGIKQEEVKK